MGYCLQDCLGFDFVLIPFVGCISRVAQGVTMVAVMLVEICVVGLYLLELGLFVARWRALDFGLDWSRVLGFGVDLIYVMLLWLWVGYWWVLF